jgi:hypothetical protein
MAYNVTLSDGTTIVTIPDGAIFNTYSVPIIGQNTSAYGDDVAAAFLRTLENFAFNLPPDTNPNIPGSLKLEGQLWYDTNTKELNFWNGTAWQSLLTGTSGFTDVGGDILPSTDSAYDIGSTGLRWAEGWFDNVTFGGTLTAQAGSALTVSSGTFTTDGGSTVDISGSSINIDTATMDGKLTLADPDATTTASLFLPEAAGAPGGGTSIGDIWLENDGIHVHLASGVEVLAVTAGLGGGVTSFNTRSGAVTSAESDYSSFYTQKTAGSTSSISATSTWTFNNTPAFANAAPFTITDVSKPLITNLNADQLDGQEGSYYAVDADVVKLSGNQDVAGNKTFTGQSTFDYSSGGEVAIFKGTSTGTTNQVYITFRESNNTEIMRIGDDQSGNSSFYFDYEGAASVFHRRQSASRIDIDSGGVNLYAGASVLSIETTDGNGSQDTSRARVKDLGGTSRNIGFNETPTVNLNTSRGITESDVGAFLTRTDPGAVVYTLSNSTDIPTGGSMFIHNDNASNTLTIAEGTATLQWINGSGSSPPTGDRTVVYNGLVTIRKKSTSVWQIWGSGIV